MIDAGMIDLIQEPANSRLDAETLAAGNALAQQFATSDWLGPLAPIALSPFFGLATLSGVATYGPDWLQERSSLFADGSPLNNPVLFWTMVTLAVVTSLPRLTKVSKPIALVAENLESYSAIIIMIIVRFVGLPESDTIATATQNGFLVAGVGSLPLDVAMAVFAALNIFVVNVVKLFFEFLVWIIPFPTIDAMVEAANKSICAGLMALYLYSPTLATIVNLGILAGAALVFGWCYRRLGYYRETVAGPVLAWLAPGWFRQRGSTFTAFSETGFEGLPSYTRLAVEHQGDTYRIHGRWLWKSISQTLDDCQTEVEHGLLTDTLSIRSGTQFVVLKHRKWIEADQRWQGVSPSTRPSSAAT
ncbi:MAG: hypothetical protein ACE361_17520 [Aureliella sp.]